jgi:hypothetical protein
VTTKVRVEPALPETATVTEPRPADEVRQAIAAAVLKADLDLAEDLMIALQVSERMARDTGERVELLDFVREQGFEPGDLGLE